MNISIITPHYNDIDGLKHIYYCLGKQTSDVWEWVIVDDMSDEVVKQELEKWYRSLGDIKIKLICNATKTNASVCRNIGADNALNDNLVFLDSDDSITQHFIAHRQVAYKDFAVFINTAVIDKDGLTQNLPKVEAPYLNYFLKAQFIWPITAVLWNKSFFNEIGKFHPHLPRLQDVELNIRALQKSKEYKVVDAPVDFYYNVKPIRERTNFVKPVCEAIHLFISELLDINNLNIHQKSLLSGYYYSCTRYLERLESTKDVPLVLHNLKLFYKKGFINGHNYTIGYMILKMYAVGLLSGKQFLRINRYLFKPTHI